MGLVYGIVTVILMIVFVGIVIWAWRDERAPDFEEAASLPLRDDAEGTKGIRR